MFIIQIGTTPCHHITLPENADSYKHIEATYKQGGFSLVKHYQNNTLPDGMTFDGKKVNITLSQAETKTLHKGDITLHVRAMTADDIVQGSQIWDGKVVHSNSEEILE